MDAFSLMKFWRTTGGGSGGELNGEDAHSVANPSVASRIDRPYAVDDEVDADESFIDFEFTVADYDDKKEKYVAARNAGSGSIDENQKADSIDQIKSWSTISFFKSSPKLRVLMLFKKSKSDAISAADYSSAAATTTTPNRYNQRRSEQSKGGLAIKCRVEEIPIISFIARVNSWRDKSQIKDGTTGYSSNSNRSSYWKLLKPLYLKRFTEKATLISSHEANPHTPWKSGVEKQGDRPAVLKIVCKHLGMSRLSSPAAAQKKDDYSLHLQQQDDGIQSAILHCKRSYSSKRRESEVALSDDHGLIM